MRFVTILNFISCKFSYQYKTAVIYQSSLEPLLPVGAFTAFSITVSVVSSWSVLVLGGEGWWVNRLSPGRKSIQLFEFKRREIDHLHANFSFQYLP